MKALAMVVLGVFVVLSANATTETKPDPRDMPTGQQRSNPRPNVDGVMAIYSASHNAETNELALTGANLDIGMSFGYTPEILIGGFDVEMLVVDEDCVFPRGGRFVRCSLDSFPLQSSTCYSVSLTNMGPGGKEWYVESVFCTASDLCELQICPQEGN